MNTPEQMRDDPDDPRHGTNNGYSNLKCRCPRCRAAWAATVQKDRHARKVPDHVHGTENGYTNYRCRCTPCKTAWATATSDRRQARREEVTAS